MRLILTLLPIIILITMLIFNYVFSGHLASVNEINSLAGLKENYNFTKMELFFTDPLSGPNQIALLITSSIAIIIAYCQKTTIKNLVTGITDSIKSSINAMIILLIIGGLTSTWILSGIVPAMIYYGIELINPHFFLVSTCLICAIVSISTGSSWTTVATIGIALIVVGKALSIPDGLVAGAIISGAYFGDKMSPLSETTNLAPSVSGSNLIDHIKYMTYTTVPTMLITLLLFFFIGLFSNTTNEISLENTNQILEVIESNFYIGWKLLILPFIIVILIYKRVSAIKTLAIGLIAGIWFACMFQGDLINKINLTHMSTTTDTITQSVFSGIQLDLQNQEVNKLLQKGGVTNMIWVVILVLSAMIFGGVMYAGGFLKKITDLLVSKSASHTQLIGSTVGSCLFFNTTACDQYLAIVIPGRMFKEKYKEHNLAPTNLSRTIEDSGTVTSVLIPWNSCAAYHASQLAVNPIVFLPFCFFNIISPFMTLLFAYLNIRIKKLKNA